ncbi:MAG: hypothetical protein FJX04_03510 [Alphaproteobacteria bacterium]|nr:hypothetical protein [Alphaproteobacteria bacterium]
MMETSPALALSACREVATHYRDMVKEPKNMKVRNAGQRLANWILTEADVLSQSSFELRIQKTVLASRLGMTNAHLSRGFNTLWTHGVVLRGLKFDIIDRVALQTYAHPDPLIDDLNS